MSQQCRLSPPVPGSECDDGNPCTEDVCDENLGCMTRPLCSPLPERCYSAVCVVNSQGMGTCSRMYNGLTCPPIANPDTPVFQKGSIQQTFNVAANDEVYDAAEEFVWVLQQVPQKIAGESVSLSSNGILTYTAGPHFLGSRTFHYRICLVADGSCFVPGDITVFVLDGLVSTDESGGVVVQLPSSNPSQEAGACCEANSCSETLLSQCLGYWAGPSTECEETSCLTSTSSQTTTPAPAPKGACCNPSGTDHQGDIIVCTMCPLSVCQYIGGTWQGPGTVCSEVSCPVQPTSSIPMVPDFNQLLECKPEPTPICGYTENEGCPYGYDEEWNCVPKPPLPNCTKEDEWKQKMARLYKSHYKGDELHFRFEGMLDGVCDGEECQAPLSI